MTYLSLRKGLDENMKLKRENGVQGTLTWSLPGAIDTSPAPHGVCTVHKAVPCGSTEKQKKNKLGGISDLRARGGFPETKRISPVTLYLAPLAF